MAENQEIALPVSWELDDNLVTQYATDLAIQSNEHEFILYFFESNPPLIIGGKEEVEEILRTSTDIHVKNKCIAKIVVARGRMKSFLNLMVSNYRQQEQSGESEE